MKPTMSALCAILMLTSSAAMAQPDRGDPWAQQGGPRYSRGDRTQTTRGRACRQPDCSWAVVN